MSQAVVGLLLGLVTGGLSVYSLWLITGFTANAAKGLKPVESLDRPKRWAFSKWDPEDFADEDEPFPEVSSKPVEAVKADPEATAATVAATFRVFFAFLLKAPLLFAVAYVAQSLGNVALHWCVGGVVLVYFLAVFWAVVRTNRQ